MFNQVETLSARAVRDEDELEGTLLPVATQIIPDVPNIENPAVPLASFEYDTAIVVEWQQQQENVAFSIPQNVRGAVADDSRSRVKLAQSKGLIAAEEEKDAIRNSNREVFSKDYFSQQAFQAANHNAKLRDSQGLQLPDTSSPSLSVQAGKNEKNAEGQREQLKKSGGYQVGGYKVKEYSSGSDYETHNYDIPEYRSVYD